MHIIRTERFKSELQDIMEYIANDSLLRAFEFENKLNEQIKNLPNFPYKCRKSLKSNDKNIRDLVYKNYIIPYKIYKDKILILGIFSQNKWNLH